MDVACVCGEVFDLPESKKEYIKHKYKKPCLPWVRWAKRNGLFERQGQMRVKYADTVKMKANTRSRKV